LTKFAGTLLHWRNGNVDWRIAGRMAAGSVPATLIALAILSAINGRAAWLEPALATAIGLALIFAAAALLVCRRIMPMAQSAAASPADRSERLASTVLLGLLLGMLVTLTSVGAGALGLALLIFV
jgi:uncharacterized membrane protein YfcA